MLSTIKKHIKESDSKVLIKNFGYLTLLQIAGYIFPLVTIPYLARTIGADSFGRIYFASAVISWFMSVITWGMDYTATRDVSRNRTNIEKVSSIFSNVICARFLLLFLCFLLLLFLIFVIPQFKDNSKVLMITFLMLPGHILFPDWLFQALERMKYITILSLLSKALFTILVFAFIKEKDDYVLQPFFTSLGYLVSGFIAMFLILGKWNIQFHLSKWSEIKQTLYKSFDVFLNNLMPNLYNSLSSVFLGVFAGDVANGILSAGTKWIGISQQFFHILSRTFFPFLARRIDKHTLFARLNIITSLIISILLFIFSPFIIRFFYTIEFENSIIVLRILAFSILFMSLSNTYGTNYMILIGKEKLLRRITMIVSIFGFLISIPLIKYYSFYGAACTIMISRTLLGLSITIVAKRLKKIYNGQNIYTKKIN